MRNTTADVRPGGGLPTGFVRGRLLVAIDRPLLAHFQPVCGAIVTGMTQQAPSPAILRPGVVYATMHGMHKTNDESTTGHAPSERLTYKQAAERLGISPGAARMRCARGTLRCVDTPGGVRVVWPQPEQPHDTERTPHDIAQTHDDARAEHDRERTLHVAALESEIVYLRKQLDERTEEIRRRDHIIAGLVERLPALAAGGEIGPVRDAPVARSEGSGRAKTADMREDAATPAASPWSRFLRWVRGE
jgi:hypothetical protein